MQASVLIKLYGDMLKEIDLVFANHDLVVGDGSIPLTLLETNVNNWIAATK